MTGNITKLLAARDELPVTRRRVLVHEWAYKTCPKCKGKGTQKKRGLTYPSGDACYFDITCQFCYGEGESGYVERMVECYKTKDGRYVPIKGKKK
jgi:DnaJ-class molecular chaperone